MIRIFQAIFLTLLITAYGLLAGGCLWRFACDACSSIFQMIETRVQAITRHRRSKLDFGQANASQHQSFYSDANRAA